MGINHEQPSVVPGSDLAPSTKACCMLANSTAIAESFGKMNASKYILFNQIVFRFSKRKHELALTTSTEILFPFPIN